MALQSKSKITYGIEINSLNSSIDFKNSGVGSPEFQATLTKGFYTLSDFATEVANQLNIADPSNTYACTVDRTTAGGLQNRITITTSDTSMKLLFGTGSRFGSSAGPTLGFLAADYTGANTYTGYTTCGTVLIPTLVGYNYLSPNFMKKAFGSINVSASGVKESIVFQIQEFLQVQFKYEQQTKVINEWTAFLTWAIQQKPIEFTPEISSPNSYYDVTLESTAQDGKGLAFQMTEMLPDFPFYYDTGLLKFRVIV